MLAENKKRTDKSKLQACFCYWLHQNSLEISTSEALIWWSDHQKWVKQKSLPNWSLLPWSACQAPTQHSQLPETYCHSPLPVTGLRGKLNSLPQLQNTVWILVSLWSSQHDTDPSRGAFGTRATCYFQGQNVSAYIASTSVRNIFNSGHYACCPLNANLSAFLPGNTTGITSKALQQFLPELLAIIKAGWSSWD